MTRIHSENEGLNPKQSPALRAKPVSGVYACNPNYRMILAHFIGKKKWQIDARSRRRVEAFPRPRKDARQDASAVGQVPVRAAAIRRIQRPVAQRPDRPVALARGLPRAVDIDDFDLPVVVGGEAGPLKCMRRSSIIRARNSWIGGSTLPSHKSRA